MVVLLWLLLCGFFLVVDCYWLVGLVCVLICWLCFKLLLLRLVSLCCDIVVCFI